MKKQHHVENIQRGSDRQTLKMKTRQAIENQHHAESNQQGGNSHEISSTWKAVTWKSIDSSTWGAIHTKIRLDRLVSE